MYSLIPNDDNGEDLVKTDGIQKTTILGESKDRLHLRLGRVVKSLLKKLDQLFTGVESDDDNNDWYEESTISMVSLSSDSSMTLRENRRRMVFMAADQFNRGSRYLSDESERIAVAKINLEAAQAAMSLSAFIPARDYAKAAIDLLMNGKVEASAVWEDAKNYDLILAVHTIHTEMSACVGKYHNQESYDIAQAVLLHGKCLHDKLPVYLSQIDAYGHVTDFSRAMAIARDVLKQLGEPIIPKKANMLHVVIALAKTKRLAKGKSNEGFLSLSMMDDAKKSAAMRILNRYAVHAVMSQRTPDLLLALLCKFQLTIKYGLHKISPTAIASYGLVLASMGNLDEANRLGKISMKLFEQIDATEWEANCIQIYNAYVAHWRESYSVCMQSFLRGYKLGMSHGDIEFAFYNGSCYCYTYFMSGLHLSPLENDFRRYCTQMAEYKRESNYAVAAPGWQLVRNLIGLDGGSPLKLVGTAIDEDSFVQKHTAANNIGALQTFWFQKAQLCYFFGDLYEAERVSIEYAKTKSNLATHLFTVTHTFFYALTCLGLARATRKRKYRVKARSLIKEMTSWVRHGNINLPNKIMLLNAEYLALSETDEAKLRKAYDSAILTSSRAGYIQDAAICNELAGIRFKELDDEYWSSSYLRRSRELYVDWGAKAKAQHLMRSHKQVFQEELESSQEHDEITISIMSQSTAGRSTTNVSTTTSCNDETGDIVGSFMPPTARALLQPKSRHSTSFRGIERFDPSAGSQHFSVSDSYPRNDNKGRAMKKEDGDSTTFLSTVTKVF